MISVKRFSDLSKNSATESGAWKPMGQFWPHRPAWAAVGILALFCVCSGCNNADVFSYHYNIRVENLSQHKIRNVQVSDAETPFEVSTPLLLPRGDITFTRIHRSHPEQVFISWVDRDNESWRRRIVLKRWHTRALKEKGRTMEFVIRDGEQVKLEVK